MQISEFSTKELSDLIYTSLKDLKDDGTNKTDVVLQTPTATSKFPCRVIETPLKQVTQSDNAVPIKTRYQVTIEHWENIQRDVMSMGELTDSTLRGINLIRTSTSPMLFDEVTKKYRLNTTYEMTYYGVNNSFEVIRQEDKKWQRLTQVQLQHQKQR